MKKKTIDKVCWFMPSRKLRNYLKSNLIYRENIKTYKNILIKEAKTINYKKYPYELLKYDNKNKLKIYIIDIDKKFRPPAKFETYPKDNYMCYGVEDDFFYFINNNPQIITNNHKEADFHYLPVFWTNYFLNNDYGRFNFKKLEKEVQNKIIDDAKTFTICQYGDGTVIDIRKTKKFLASRKTNNGYDIPLLAKEHNIKNLTTSEKIYKASFTGNLNTHSIRKEMAKNLENIDDIFIQDSSQKGYSGSNFLNIMHKSLISLCPRGYGGGSFRMYESMALSVVPFIISDIDNRPFKKFINWNEISFYKNNANDLKNFIYTLNTKELISMGEKAKYVFENELNYQKWCKYVLMELENSN